MGSLLRAGSQVLCVLCVGRFSFSGLSVCCVFGVLCAMGLPVVRLVCSVLWAACGFSVRCCVLSLLCVGYVLCSVCFALWFACCDGVCVDAMWCVGSSVFCAVCCVLGVVCCVLRSLCFPLRFVHCVCVCVGALLCVVCSLS